MKSLAHLKAGFNQDSFAVSFEVVPAYGNGALP